MKQFELQKPTSQLFNAVNFFQIGCSKQSNKTHYLRKIIFVTSSLQNSIPADKIFLGCGLEYISLFIFLDALGPNRHQGKLILITYFRLTFSFLLDQFSLIFLKLMNYSQSQDHRNTMTKCDPTWLGFPSLFIMSR